MTNPDRYDAVQHIADVFDVPAYMVDPQLFPPPYVGPWRRRWNHLRAVVTYRLRWPR